MFLLPCGGLSVPALQSQARSLRRLRRRQGCSVEGRATGQGCPCMSASCPRRRPAARISAPLPAGGSPSSPLPRTGSSPRPTAPCSGRSAGHAAPCPSYLLPPLLPWPVRTAGTQVQKPGDRCPQQCPGGWHQSLAVVLPCRSLGHVGPRPAQIPHACLPAPGQEWDPCKAASAPGAREASKGNHIAVQSYGGFTSF